MQVQFVDRYTGDPRGRPTEFNACFECDAMGCYPTGPGPDDPFERCEACNGTGRIPLWRGIFRIPRWLVKGLRFVWNMNAGGMRGCRASWHSRWQHLALTFKVAFLVDLGLWAP